MWVRWGTVSVMVGVFAVVVMVGVLHAYVTFAEGNGWSVVTVGDVSTVDRPGVGPGDLVVVDPAAEYRAGSTVVVALDRGPVGMFVGTVLDGGPGGHVVAVNDSGVVVRGADVEGGVVSVIPAAGWVAGDGPAVTVWVLWSALAVLTWWASRSVVADLRDGAGRVGVFDDVLLPAHGSVSERVTGGEVG